jgi:radical SAM additional 4Fe4S-binding domain
MRIHTFKCNNKVLAFFPDTFRFFEINENTEDLINSYLNSESIDEVTSKFGISCDEYNGFINNLKNYAYTDIKIEDKTLIDKNSNNVLDRLVLNISNNCNLGCKYCYAHGGSYNSDEGMMTNQVAFDSLDLFFNKFDKINGLQIFGGEPCLNIPIIENILKHLDDMKNSGIIESTPNIGLVTNGTILNDTIIELIKKYNITVTVSLDGPAVVNDSLRVFKNGKGTSEIIEKNILKMKAETGQPSTIEVTYNNYHVENNMSIIDIIKYFDAKFKGIGLHIAPVSGSKDEPFLLKDRNEFIDSVDDVFETNKDNKLLNYSLVQRIIDTIKYKRSSKYICSAGIGTLSVSIKGDIYPCFMFTDQTENLLGNIYDDNVFSSPTMKKHMQKYLNFSKLTERPCKDCFVNRICSGCLGSNYFDTGEIFTPTEAHCDMQRKMVEKVLFSLSNLKKELTKW